VNDAVSAAEYVGSTPSKAPILWLSIFIAIVAGRYAEWVPGLASIPLAKVAFLLALVSTLRARDYLPKVRVLTVPIVKPAICFLSLAIISIAFSVYKSQSLNQVYGVIVSLMSFVLLVKVTQTLDDLERLFKGLTVAAGGLALATIFSYSGGRAQINSNFDPNDLAYGLVSILPMIRVLGMTATKRRSLFNGMVVATIIAVLLTGSRGGVLALVVEVLLLVAFPLGFAKNGGLKRFHLGRFVIVIAVIAALCAAMWGFLPMEARERAATLLELQNDYNMTSSKDGRTEIWRLDIAAVWQRPIGYGLGSSEYVNGLIGGHYRAPHNVFVQSFVELGIPGLTLFVLSYLVTFWRTGKVSRLGKSGAEGSGAKAALYARALRVGLAANLVAGFFLSHAYDALPWILIAICAALVRIGGELPSPAPAPAALT
jgi:O-antigen ligase